MSIAGYVVPGQIICPILKKEDGVVRRFEAGQGVSLSDIDESRTVKALVANVVGKVRLVSLDGNKEGDEIEIDEGSKKEVTLRFQVNVDNKLNSDYALDDRTAKAERPGTSFLPEVGDVVYGRITRISSMQANMEILVIENQGTVASDAGFGAFGSGEGLISGATHSAAAGGVSTTGDIGEGFGGIIRIQDVRETERDKIKMQNCFKPGDIVRATVLSLGDGNNYYMSTARNDLGVVFARSAAGQQMYAVDWQTMRCSVTGKTELRKVAKPF